MSEPMRPIDPQYLRQLEAKAREIADVLERACREVRDPRGQKVGFALMLFSFEGPEFTWISNAQRALMVKTMQEFINANPPDQTSEDRN